MELTFANANFTIGNARAYGWTNHTNEIFIASAFNAKLSTACFVYHPGTLEATITTVHHGTTCTIRKRGTEKWITMRAVKRLGPGWAPECAREDQCTNQRQQPATEWYQIHIKIAFADLSAKYLIAKH